MPLRWKDARLKQEIEQIVSDWAPVVLKDWDYKAYWDEKQYLATASAMPRYEDIALHFNLPRIRQQIDSFDQLEELIVHELSHGLTWILAREFKTGTPMGKEVKEHFEESVTTAIAKALLRARRSKKARC